jgi:hypothetical protein
LRVFRIGGRRPWRVMYAYRTMSKSLQEAAKAKKAPLFYELLCGPPCMRQRAESHGTQWGQGRVCKQQGGGSHARLLLPPKERGSVTR